jgi:hypothetical protein
VNNGVPRGWFGGFTPPPEIPNYSCLQNPWLGCHCPQIPGLSVLSSAEFVEPPEQNSWVRHWLWTPRPSRFIAEKASVAILEEAGWDWRHVWTGMEKRKSLVPSWVEFWTFQPVASRYNDWATSVPVILTVAALNSRRRKLYYCPKSIYRTICYNHYVFCTSKVRNLWPAL